MEDVCDWSITVQIIYILFLWEIRQQLVSLTAPCLISSSWLLSCCLEAPLHCTVKMAGGATVRLGCRKARAKKASPAPPSAMLSLKLVLKAGPSLKSDLLIAAPPYAADLFLVCAFRVLHWVFRLHRFLFQAIVQLRSPTFIPPQLPPPLPSPSGSLPPAPWRSTSSLRFPPLPPPSPGTTLPPKVIT